MKNYIARVALVVLVVPFLVFIALTVRAINQLPLVMLVVVFTIGCSIELRHMLEPSASWKRALTSISISLLPVVIAYFSRLMFQDLPIFYVWLAPIGIFEIVFFIIYTSILTLQTNKDTVSGIIQKVTSNAFYAMYPGLLASAIVIILSASHASGELIVWYAFMVFSNDSLAWLVGISLGRIRGIVFVSPHKCLEGFLAGMLASIGTSFLSASIFSYAIVISWWQTLILGLVCGLAVILGDLFESAIKRAAGVKDSGTTVPGRGGFLDSFDSLLFAAPVFVILSSFFGMLN